MDLRTRSLENDTHINLPLRWRHPTLLPTQHFCYKSQQLWCLRDLPQSSFHPPHWLALTQLPNDPLFVNVSGLFLVLSSAMSSRGQPCGPPSFSWFACHATKPVAPPGPLLAAPLALFLVFVSPFSLQAYLRLTFHSALGELIYSHGFNEQKLQEGRSLLGSPLHL